jgi:hypothetical protein
MIILLKCLILSRCFLAKSPLSFLATVAASPRISQKDLALIDYMYKNWWKNRPETLLKLSKCDKTFQKFFSFKKHRMCEFVVFMYPLLVCVVACW